MNTCPMCDSPIDVTIKRCTGCGAFFSDEETDSVQEEIKEKRKGKGTVAQLFRITTIVIWIAGFITGIVLGNGYRWFEWSIAFMCWVSAFIFGLFLYGMGEIISLLHSINQKIAKETNE